MTSAVEAQTAEAAEIARVESVEIEESVSYIYNDSFNELKAKVDTVELEHGIWDKGPVIRGAEIDEALGNNLGYNYPVIDRESEGIITSIDLNCSTYQNGNRLETQIKKDVDKLYNFQGRQWNGINIRAEDITGKQLQLVVPDVELSEVQIGAINNAIDYAENKNIDIIMTIVKER